MIFQSVIRRIKEIVLIQVIQTITNIENIENMPNLTLHGSEGLALKQRAGTGGAWQDPDGFSDPNNKWTDEPKAYDNNTDTWAILANLLAVGAWSEFLELTFSTAITANKIRIFPDISGATSKIDVDVKRNGSWINIYEGTFTWRQWNEYTFAEGVINAIRVRIYNNYIMAQYPMICEVDLWKVASVGGELIGANFPFDRNMDSVPKSWYSGPTSHGATVRWSYTVPSGHNAELQSFFSYLFAEVQSVGGVINVSLYLTPSGGSAHMLCLGEMQKQDDLLYHHQAWAFNIKAKAGDKFEMKTSSTDGTAHGMGGASSIVEFDE